MIRNLLLVGAGGALGSIARYAVSLLFAYAARDYCFVIASEGVTKKKSLGALFLLLPLD